jgi:hypothetical protein
MPVVVAAACLLQLLFPLAAFWKELEYVEKGLKFSFPVLVFFHYITSSGKQTPGFVPPSRIARANAAVA